MLWEKKIIHILSQKKKTLGVAESCTGGFISHRLTNIPGSSVAFKGGLTAYSNPIKINVLGVPEKLIQQYGAVSLPVVQTMARNARKIFHADYGIGISGIAGPGGGSTTKPVGLVHIAVASKKGTLNQELRLKGTRIAIKTQASTKALQLLLSLIKSER